MLPRRRSARGRFEPIDLRIANGWKRRNLDIGSRAAERPLSTHLAADRAALIGLIRETELRPQPDAEFRTGGIPIIAIEVIERHHHFESTLQDAIHELTHLATRQQDNQNRYSRLWYFLHAQTIPIFQRALSKLDQQIQERVRLYGLDAQEVTQ